MTKEDVILSINGLSAEVYFRDRWVPILDQVDLEVGRGRTVALIGESGCGKSTLARSLLRLHSRDVVFETAGSIEFMGTDLRTCDRRHLREIRGRRIAAIFQDPTTSLDPVITIGRQMAETIRATSDATRHQALRESAELLDHVRIREPQKVLGSYPHELSGGMLQRVAIAMAISCRPDLLVADEPTSALDVTVQESILALISELQSESDMSIVFITHDLGVAAAISDVTNVMYAGRIVECGPTREVLTQPAMPYTAALVSAAPSLKARREGARIIGNPPGITERPPGCSFAPRCRHAVEICAEDAPVLRVAGPNHISRCHFGPETFRAAGSVGRHQMEDS